MRCHGHKSVDSACVSWVLLRFRGALEVHSSGTLTSALTATATDELACRAQDGDWVVKDTQIASLLATQGLLAACTSCDLSLAAC